MNLAGIDEGYRGGRRGGGTSHVPTPARVSIAGVSSTSPKTRTGTTIHTVMDSLTRWAATFSRVRWASRMSATRARSTCDKEAP